MNDLIELLLGGAGTTVMALGAWAIARLGDWLRLRADSEVRAYLMEGLRIAVEYGQAEARRRAAEAGLAGPAARNVAAEAARDYALSRYPDALKRFNVDAAALDQMIRARMPKPPFVTAGV